MRAARILFIDDDALIRRLLEKFFVKEGFDVEVAHDGDVGVSLHSRCPFDVVVTDILMPHKEGFETIQELRAISPDLFIIAISGGGRNSPTTYLDFAKSFGANLTLEKPFSPKLLLTKIKEMIGGVLIAPA